ncbi:MAG: phage tail protein [Pseudomonadota bacterium]
MSDLIPVLAMPIVDPGAGRIAMTVPHGSTVDEIVAMALPDAPDIVLQRTRVTLVARDGRMTTLSPTVWHLVKPHAGVQVIIRVVPTGGLRNLLRTILTVIVSIAAVALAAVFAPTLAGFLGISQGLAQGLIGAAVTTVGRLLINALVPLDTPSDKEEDPTFTIEGLQNQARIDAPVPVLLGRIRYAPPYAATPYTEIVGDEQYVRAAFLVGYGEVEISSLKIGETPIDEYDEVTTEIRFGRDGDDPLSLYPQQVIEAQLGVELTRDLPRDDNGDTIGKVGTIKPETRFTAGDAAEVGIIIGFPQGLVRYNDEGRERSLSVEIRVEHRLAGASTWTQVATLNFSAKKPDAFFRYYRWALPTRGRYEIRLTRLTTERTKSRELDRSAWIAIQSFRPEYPLQFAHPLALIAVRIKATEQLNGPLDAINIIGQRVCLDWNTANNSWISRATSNPASLFRYVLQGPANTFPATDAQIDLDALGEWHDYCVSKGLEYNRVHDFEGSLFDALADVARAGRALPHHDGTKWTIIIDRPRSLVVDHVSEHNARGLKFTRAYFRPPDAFRITFQDETADFAPNERIVPWPGHVGDVEVTEEVALPGKTDPNEIWREARRRMYELIHRPDRFTALQDGAARVATRGDLVRISHSVLDTVHTSARVRAVIGMTLQLDQVVSMEAGANYAIRFLVPGATESDPWTSRLVSVANAEGERDVLTVIEGGALPQIGDIVMFGPLGIESEEAIVAGVEAAEDMSSNMLFVSASPIIDTLTDAESPPLWDGRVGAAIADSTDPPAVPTVFSVDTTPEGDGLNVLLIPGSGSSAVVATFTVRHRRVGETTFNTDSEPAGSGGVAIRGYTTGDQVQFDAFATSSASIDGPSTSLRTVEVGVESLPPEAPVSASVVGGRGSATLTVATPPEYVSELRIYRSATDEFENATLVGSIPATESETLNYTDGDATQPNLVTNPGFDTDTDWTKGDGWAIAAGVATKTPGVTSDLEQPITVTGAKTYRYRVPISGRTAGAVRVKLTGNGTDIGPSSGNSTDFLGSLIASTGQTTLGILGSADFDGSLDDLTVFEESTASIPQGTLHYFVTAANAEGLEGPEAYAGSTVVI